MDKYTSLPTELESTAIVRFQDCDPFRHLNNARYVDYFINARTDQVLEHYGLELLRDGQTESWVVNKSKIAFITPAALGEKVLIRTRLIGVSDKTLTVEGIMLNEEGRRLKAVLWIEFTYISLTSGRPVNHSEDLMRLFNAVLIEVGTITDFASCPISPPRRPDSARSRRCLTEASWRERAINGHPDRPLFKSRLNHRLEAGQPESDRFVQHHSCRTLLSGQRRELVASRESGTYDQVRQSGQQGD
jgi:thioesterase III